MWLQECQKYIYQAILNKKVLWTCIFHLFVTHPFVHCNELEMKLKLYSHITGQSTVQLPLSKFEVICFFPDLFALSYKIYFKNS